MCCNLKPATLAARLVVMNVLETERLLVTRFTTADAAFILALLNSPGWLQYIGDRGIRTVEEAEKYIQKVPLLSYHAHNFGLYRVSLKEDEKPVGTCGLLKRDTLPDADIGFAFLPEFCGHGFAFEAASAIVQFEQKKHQLKRLLAITLAENTASRKLLEKLGMKYERDVQLTPEDDVLMLYAVDSQPS